MALGRQRRKLRFQDIKDESSRGAGEELRSYMATSVGKGSGVQ